MERLNYKYMNKREDFRNNIEGFNRQLCGLENLCDMMNLFWWYPEEPVDGKVKESQYVLIRI